ncbi:response regulator transcription factor (plasmid) [Salipiger sp. H15]|uniref:Response regulator transcription factor n=1 Tax=Alloyangia sp. H15 TaxID=3029062 RepID=A0AAU8AT58_9RHOB
MPVSRLRDHDLRETSRADAGWSIELIDSRVLDRECFELSLRSAQPNIDVTSFSSVDEWSRAPRPASDAAAIIFNIGSLRASNPKTRDALTTLVELAAPTPVLVLATSEDLADMLDALDCGARGYVPSSVGVAVMTGATRLAIAGGVFLPALSVMSMREKLKDAQNDFVCVSDIFTSRQAAVADALRRGKANKLIAYELNMCESTVKVHIRTIMKKLQARNRTEAAYQLNQLFPPDQA